MSSGLIGQTLGQYQIRMLLGKGGMSTVYLAHQPAMERTVAVKVLPREFLHDDTFLMRFQQEVRTIGNLEHLHILPVYDVGEAQGIPYYVMRYLSGGTLADLIAARLPGLSTVVRVISQVADALDYAHAHGIIHRDLKPSNVLLDQAGNAYLADFGIARVQQAASITTGERVIGTPPYIAPEMVRSGEETTHAVDVYALGIIAYEMLTGDPPYREDDPMKTLMAHVLEPVPSILDFDPNFSPAIDAVIRRCLAKTPEKRIPSAGAFARELAQAAELGYPTVQSAAVPEQVNGGAFAAPPAAEPPVEFAYTPDSKAGEKSERRWWSGCLLPLGLVIALLGGMLITAAILTGGRPFSLLSVFTPEASATLTPTVTLTPDGDTVVETPEPGTEVPDMPTEAPPPGGGGRLAFASNRDGDYEIFLVDADGENLRQLTSNNAFDFDPTWSPDGTRLAFASTSDGDAEIKIITLADGTIEQLTSNIFRDLDPAWSPDGEWIAFASDRDGDYELYIMRIDGSDVRQLTYNEIDDYSPSWSPDSTQLAYYVRVDDNDDTAELYVLDIDRGTSSRLTRNATLDKWPDWSPDGLSVIYSSVQGEEGRRGLFNLDLISGQAEEVLNTSGHDDDPAWSSDGALIAFDSDRDGDGFFDIYVYDMATGVLRQVTVEIANDVTPVWQPLP